MKGKVIDDPTNQSAPPVHASLLRLSKIANRVQPNPCNRPDEARGKKSHVCFRHAFAIIPFKLNKYNELLAINIVRFLFAFCGKMRV